MYFCIIWLRGGGGVSKREMCFLFALMVQLFYIKYVYTLLMEHCISGEETLFRGGPVEANHFLHRGWCLHFIINQ